MSPFGRELIKGLVTGMGGGIIATLGAAVIVHILCALFCQ